jgi:hypothetical protein
VPSCIRYVPPSLSRDLSSCNRHQLLPLLSQARSSPPEYPAELSHLVIISAYNSLLHPGQFPSSLLSNISLLITQSRLTADTIFFNSSISLPCVTQNRADEKLGGVGEFLDSQSRTWLTWPVGRSVECGYLTVVFYIDKCGIRVDVHRSLKIF